MLPRNVVSISAVITSLATRHLWLPSMHLLQQMSCWPKGPQGGWEWRFKEKCGDFKLIDVVAKLV